MGEVADMLLDGTLCEQCGVYIEEPAEEPVPRRCADCERAEALIEDGVLDLIPQG